MQVKRFVAPNMRQALKQVREELGDDAVILSNKRVAEGVELLISMEEPVLGEANADSSGIDILRDALAEPQQAAAAPQPSRLQLEAERIQQSARQRAEVLAASLQKQTEQNSGAFAAELFQQQSQQQSAREPLQPESVADIQSVVSAASAVSASGAGSAARHGELDNLRTELQCMRDLMEQQFSNIAWGQFSQC